MEPGAETGPNNRPSPMYVGSPTDSSATSVSKGVIVRVRALGNETSECCMSKSNTASLSTRKSPSPGACSVMRRTDIITPRQVGMVSVSRPVLVLIFAFYVFVGSAPSRN